MSEFYFNRECTTGPKEEHRQVASDKDIRHTANLRYSNASWAAGLNPADDNISERKNMGEMKVEKYYTKKKNPHKYKK